jgi:DNA-binding Lrp family transcriptional regulator
VNIGIHDGILEQKHVDAMGTAIFLYLWCVRHQTKHSGLVWGGAPVTYGKINEKLGQPERTLKRWMKKLVDAGYIELTYLNYKAMRLRILKSKKFNYKQLPLPISQVPQMALTAIEPSANSGTSMVQNLALGRTKNGTSKQSVVLSCIEPTATSRALPDFVPVLEWTAYREMRVKIRKPMTERAVELAFRKLAQLKAAGHEPRDVLDQAVLNSHQGLWPIRQEKSNERETAGERRSRHNREVADTFLRGLRENEQS